MGRIRRVAIAFCLGLLLFGLTLGCQRSAIPPLRLTIGVVTRGTEDQTLAGYQRFRDYLAENLQAVVELEPAFNELQAVEQIKQQRWSLAFASSGLVAVALAEAQYIPLFPLVGPANVRAVIVTRADNAATTLADLFNQTIALGEPGSATDYYLPLYDLYGLTFTAIRLAPTPQVMLGWLRDGEVAAIALSAADFQHYRSEFSDTSFKVLHETRIVPPGAVLLAPTIDRNQQQLIEIAMRAAPSQIIADAGYLPNASLPQFEPLVEIVRKIRPLQDKVRQTPAVLTIDK